MYSFIILFEGDSQDSNCTHILMLCRNIFKNTITVIGDFLPFCFLFSTNIIMKHMLPYAFVSS